MGAGDFKFCRISNSKVAVGNGGLNSKSVVSTLYAWFSHGGSHMTASDSLNPEIKLINT